MVQSALTDDFGFELSERLSSVYSRLIGVSVVSIFNAGLIVLVIANGRGFSTNILIWLSLVGLLSLARMVLYWRYRRDPEKSGHAVHWARVSVACSLCAGILWGLGPMMPDVELESYRWLWAFAIGGMCAGAASLHAAHLPTALSFTLPACIPLAVSLFLAGTMQAAAAGAMTVAFLAITTFTAILFTSEFGRSLELQKAVALRAVELDTTNQRLSREIEDHRSTSQALHHSQKMEALGSLTGGFAHDFNNLLTVMIGNLDLIANSADLARIRDLARSAVAAGESGASLITRLLAFARKQSLSPAIVEIDAVVIDFQDLLLHAVSGSVSVGFSFAAKGIFAHVDAAHLQAALLNLVVNAREAMPRGGTITVATRKVTLQREQLGGLELEPGDFIAISVADDGKGMDAETLQRAFEPFFTTRGDRGGNGLGLSQVYGFARQSGGFSRIESAPGKGTCVTLFLPVSAQAALLQSMILPEAVAGEAKSLTILLVDDNIGVLGLLEAVVVEQGWNAVTAQDGGTALAMLEAGGPFDVVVTDIDMPGGIDGLALAGELRQRFPDLPVLLMSGAAATQPAEGEFPFLSKPFRRQGFLERIELLVRR